MRALKNICSKLEHSLICDADLVQEKTLHIRLFQCTLLKYFVVIFHCHVHRANVCVWYNTIVMKAHNNT